MADVNTEAKYLLKDFDFSVEGAHLAYTLNPLGGSASQIADEKPYVFKSENLDVTEDVQKMLDELKVDVNKADMNDMSLEDQLRVAIKEKITAILPDVYVSCWIEKITSTDVYYTIDYTTFYSPYTINSDGTVTVSDERTQVEARYVYVEVEEMEGTMVSKSQDPSIFGFTPDLEKPETWKCRLDSKDLVKAAMSDLARYDLDKNCYEKVVEAHKKFFPEDEISASLEKRYSSGAASDGKKKKSMPSGIDNDNKEKKSMSNKEEKTVEKATEDKAVDTVSTESVDLQKSLDEVTALLKSEKEARIAAEKEAADIRKAAEEAEVKKAKEEMTDVVKAYGFEKEADLVEAIFKAGEASNVILEALESLHQKVEKAKEDFGETEHGQDGQVESPSDLEKTKSSVKDILAKRKESSRKAK